MSGWWSWDWEARIFDRTVSELCLVSSFWECFCGNLLWWASLCCRELGTNSLSGTIPTEIGMLTSLNQLRVNFASWSSFWSVSDPIFSVGFLPSFFLVGILVTIRCATISTTGFGQGPMTTRQRPSAPPPTVLGCTDLVARLVCAQTHLAFRVPVAMAPPYL